MPARRLLPVPLASAALVVAGVVHAGPANAADAEAATAPYVIRTPGEAGPPGGLRPVDTRSYVVTTTGYGGSGLGLGIGGRLGTTFASGVSIALSGTYQGWETGQLAALRSALYGGAEAGYDFNLRYLMLRPYFAFGVAVTAANGKADGELAVWGGLQATWDVPKTSLFVAVDLRAVSTATEEAFTLAGYAGFGVKFGS